MNYFYDWWLNCQSPVITLSDLKVILLFLSVSVI